MSSFAFHVPKLESLAACSACTQLAVHAMQYAAQRRPSTTPQQRLPTPKASLNRTRLSLPLPSPSPSPPPRRLPTAPPTRTLQVAPFPFPTPTPTRSIALHRPTSTSFPLHRCPVRARLSAALPRPRPSTPNPTSERPRYPERDLPHRRFRGGQPCCRTLPAR